MRGLLKNNFYGAFGNVRLFLIFDAALYAALLISGNASLMNILTLLTAPALALFTASGMRKESGSKWSKYKIVLPVTRKMIVKSQFISHLGWTLLGVAGTAGLMALTVLIHGNVFFAYGLRDAVTLVLCGGVVAALMGAISYPLLYLWGAERTEAVLAISAVCSIGVVLGLTWLINALIGTGHVSDWEYYISMAIILIITAVLYALSYLVTVAVSNKREY